MIITIAKAREAADVLALDLLGLTTDKVKSAYRTHAKACHPDHHGARELQRWSRVSWAYEVLKHWAAQNPIEENIPDEGLSEGNCRACAGTGRVAVRRGGFTKPLTMMCVMCRGMGELIPEENDGD